MNKRLQILNKLAEQFGTDKLQHLYLESYSKFLPEDCRQMLEIGVAKGASALMWYAFYGKNLDLSIIDLFEDRNHVSTRWCRDRGFIPYQCDQSDIGLMSKMVLTNYEVVVDDGSHRSDHMIITWKHLFSNNLRSKGLYVIEDTETCKETFYRGGLAVEFEDTALHMFKNFTETGRLRNVYLTSGESEHFESTVDRVEVIEDKIIFIWKK